MRPAGFFLALAAAQLAQPAAAAKDALAAAQQAYVDVEYTTCRDEAQRALEQPGEKPARLDGWRLLGLCLAALGDTEQARDAFKHMLAVDWEARLPEGLSPRFTSSFREAKGSFGGAAPLTLALVDEQVDDGLREVRVKLHDELELVDKLAWRGAAGSSGGPVRAAPLLLLELPAQVDVTVLALDEAGGVVATLLVPAVKPVVAQPAVEPVEEDFPWLGVVIGAGALLLASAAVGGAALLLAQPQAVTLKTDVVFGE